MTQHIIDTDELEKLQQYVMIDMTNGVEQCKHGDYVHIDDLRALIANSPQADDVRKDALEQAAKIAEQMPLNCDEEHHAYRFSDDSKAIAWDIAHAIRQAIDKARE